VQLNTIHISSEDPRPNLNPRTVLGIVVHKALEIFYGEFNKQSLILPTLGWLEEAYEGVGRAQKEIANDEYLKMWKLGWQGLTSYYYRHISTDGGQTGHFEPPFLVEQRFRARVLAGGNRSHSHRPGRSSRLARFQQSHSQAN